MNERPWIREATSRDIDRLVDLWAEHVDFHARLDPRFERGRGSEAGFAEYLREGIERDDFLLLVAELGGGVVGFLNGELSSFPPCFVQRAHGLINDMAVSPRWQRRGIGTDLLQRAMAWFGEKGAPTVEGRVLMANPLAMGFWAKAGFEPYMQIIRSRPSGE